MVRSLGARSTKPQIHRREVGGPNGEDRRCQVPTFNCIDLPNIKCLRGQYGVRFYLREEKWYHT